MDTDTPAFKLIIGSPPVAYCPCCDTYQRVKLFDDVWHFVTHTPGAALTIREALEAGEAAGRIVRIEGREGQVTD